MGQFCDALMYCNTSCFNVCIDTAHYVSMNRYVLINKIFCEIHEDFNFKFFVENCTRKTFYNIVIFLRRLYHFCFVLIISSLFNKE